jgi:hypothetical protein
VWYYTPIRYQNLSATDDTCMGSVRSGWLTAVNTMALRGFIRALTSQGSWLRRLAIGGDTTPTYPPLYIQPTAAPTTTAVAGDIYVDSNGSIQVHNGTNFVAGGGGNVPISRSVEAASVDAYVFVADRAYRVVSVAEIHAVAGSDGGAVTLFVNKCTGTQAPSAGSPVTALSFNLKSTAATAVSQNGAGSAASLAAGDKLAFDFTGTLTALAGGCVTIILRPI